MSKNKVTPPKGFTLVSIGTVRSGDYGFASVPKLWKPLQSSEVGKPVADYVAVARSKLAVSAA